MPDQLGAVSNTCHDLTNPRLPFKICTGAKRLVLLPPAFFLTQACTRSIPDQDLCKGLPLDELSLGENFHEFSETSSALSGIVHFIKNAHTVNGLKRFPTILCPNSTAKHGTDRPDTAIPALSGSPLRLENQFSPFAAVDWITRVISYMIQRLQHQLTILRSFFRAQWTCHFGQNLPS